MSRTANDGSGGDYRTTDFENEKRAYQGDGVRSVLVVPFWKLVMDCEKTNSIDGRVFWMGDTEMEIETLRSYHNGGGDDDGEGLVAASESGIESVIEYGIENGIKNVTGTAAENVMEGAKVSEIEKEIESESESYSSNRTKCLLNRFLNRVPVERVWLVSVYSSDIRACLQSSCQDRSQ